MLLNLQTTNVTAICMDLTPIDSYNIFSVIEKIL